MTFLPETTDQRVFEVSRQWSQSLEKRGPAAPATIQSSGLLASDRLSAAEFRSHPNLSEIVPLLKAHDRKRVEVIALADIDEADEGTRHVEEIADVVPIGRRSEAEKLTIMQRKTRAF